MRRHIVVGAASCLGVGLLLEFGLGLDGVVVVASAVLAGFFGMLISAAVADYRATRPR